MNSPDPRIDLILDEQREMRAELKAIGKSLAGCQAGCARPAEARAGMFRTVVTSVVSGLIVLGGALLLHLR
jgi:hypothetical protein